MNEKQYTPEEIVDLMLNNINDYKENIKEMLIKNIEDKPELRQSWSDWFRGKPMND